MVAPITKRKKTNNHLADRKGIRPPKVKEAAITESMFLKQVSKRAEEEIKKLKQQMEFILGATKTGLDIIDSEFNIRYIDPEWAKVYGGPTGKKCYEYFMGGKAPCPGCGIPRALKTKKPAVAEEILVKENNRPIQVTTIPFQNSNGEWLVAEVNVDITERKRAEEALSKARDELEIRVQKRTAQLASANEAMRLEISERKRAEEALRRSEEEAKRLAHENTIVAGIGRIISSSLNIEEVYERFVEEVHKLISFDGIAINIINHKEGAVTVPYVVGTSVPGCHPGDAFPLEVSVTGEVAHKRSGLMIQASDRNELQDRFPTLLTAFDTGLRSVMAVPLISKDRVIGAIHFRSLKPNAYSDQDLRLAESIAFQIAGAVANAQLFAEHRRTEKALRVSEERYRTLAEAAQDTIFIIDADDHVQYVNNFGAGQLGRSPEQIIGKPRKDLFPSVVSDRQKNNLEKVLKSGKPLYVENESFSADNEVWLSTWLVPIRNEAGEVPAVLGISRDITERKRAEEALRESEEKYRTILENIEDGYYEVDLPGNFTFFNDQVCKFFGYSKDELMGMNDRQYTDQENAKKLYQTFNKVYKTGEPTKGFGWEIIRKDGTKRYIEASVSLVKNPSGQPIGYRGIVRDITERKQAEEELRTERQRFQTLSEQAPFGMLMIDKDGTFKYINPKFKELFGYDSTDIPDGRTWFRKAFPDPIYRHSIISAWKNDLESSKPGEKRSRTFTVICKDGREKNINFMPVQLETGENLMACEDITERKEAEEALQESEKKFRVLTETAASGIFIHQGEKFVYVNPASEAMTGYSREELLTMDFWNLVHPDFRELVRQRAQARQQGKSVPSRYELRIITKNGEERWVDLAVGMINFQGKPAILGTDFDITERKRAEEEMRALEEQLRQSQKIEAIGRLAGGIAHDFNNLLTVIKGYSQLSLLDLKESDPLWGNIREIQKATQRATDLTRHLLAFSRRQILDLKVLDLNSLLRDLDKMLPRIIGEDIELSTLLANDLGRVKIDPGQIEQVILNLAVNARDAMPSGGKLTIETSNVELDGEYAYNHVSVIPGHYVRLSVSDTGVGMSKDVKEKIFEPFFTTKEKGKGTGLGLSTVYGIVKQSGGNVWVYSEPEHGTTFKIYLPRVEEELDALTGRDETDSLPRGSETLLLVEDERLVRELAHRFLSGNGYTILEAADGEEALRVVQEHAGKKIHLLLTDVVMPQMGGKELADHLKRLRPGIKVLYTSGYTDEAIVHHGVLDPGTQFLQKPFSPKTLLHKVREVLDR